MHILIITDNENSDLIRALIRKKYIPITRSSLHSAMAILKHIAFTAILIDKEHHDVDTLEFILNARDFQPETPIYIPETYDHQKTDIHMNTLNKVIYYPSEQDLIRDYL